MCEGVVSVIEDDVTGRMSRTMKNLEHMLAERDCFAFVKKPIRHDVADVALDTEHLSLLFKIFEKGKIVAVGSDDRNAQHLTKFVGTSGMIDMTVGQPDLGKGNATFAHEF